MSTSPYAKVSLTDYQAAERHLAQETARTGIKVHATVYVLVNILIATINLVFVPQFLYFFFPLVGWGFGLFMHYTFGYRRADSENATRQAQVMATAVDQR